MTARVSRLPVVVVYPHTRCNCRCAMCDIWKRTENGSIEPERFARYLEDFAHLGVEWMVFSGGEPLMHPQLDALCAMVKARGLRVTILTSGLLLERNAAWIAREVDDVIVSLDGPADTHDRIRGVPGTYDAGARGVRALRGLRRDFPIAARCTVQKSNCRLLGATVAAAQALGCDSISFLAADVSSDAFDHAPGSAAELVHRVMLDADDVEVLAAEVEELIARGVAGAFVREGADKLRRIVRYFRAALGQCEAAAPRCNAPWVSAVVETDGTVRPCFFHAPVGRIGEGGVEAVVNGPQALAFRSTLAVDSNAVCRKCVCSLYRE